MTERDGVDNPLFFDDRVRGTAVSVGAHRSTGPAGRRAKRSRRAGRALPAGTFGPFSAVTAYQERAAPRTAHTGPFAGARRRSLRSRRCPDVPTLIISRQPTICARRPPTATEVGVADPRCDGSSSSPRPATRCSRRESGSCAAERGVNGVPGRNRRSTRSARRARNRSTSNPAPAAPGFAGGAAAAARASAPARAPASGRTGASPGAQPRLGLSRAVRKPLRNADRQLATPLRFGPRRALRRLRQAQHQRDQPAQHAALPPLLLIPGETITGSDRERRGHVDDRARGRAAAGKRKSRPRTQRLPRRELRGGVEGGWR